MKNRVCLNIDTKEGVYVIPFLDLKKLDRFTVGYKNLEELTNTLNNILDLSIDMEDIVSVYISGDRYKDTSNSSLSYIKYSGDNWNLDSLKEMLSLYLKQDHRRIRECDVRFVNTSSMVRFNAGASISDKDIDYAVKVFLNNGYKKQRDMYFMLRYFGSIRIDKVYSISEEVKRNDLSKMESSNDAFVQYLIELANRGDEYLERAMDELSKYSLEDISRSLSKTNYNVFDGLSSSSTLEIDDETNLLVELTGMTIDELKMLQPDSGKLTMNNGYAR